MLFKYLSITLKVLLLSMKDMNVAKLTASDLPLFNGITSDLFPGIDVPILDYNIVSETKYIYKHALHIRIVYQCNSVHEYNIR